MGFLFNPDTRPYADAFVQHAEPAARALGVELIPTRVHTDAEIERAITALRNEPGSGLILLPDSTINARSDLIIGLAASSCVPAIYASRFQAIGGGLISYGVDPADLWQGAASSVDRILRGAKPADLPVYEPTKFRLVVNLKTAKVLGLTVPPTLLLEADEVIQ